MGIIVSKYTTTLKTILMENKMLLIYQDKLLCLKTELIRESPNRYTMCAQQNQGIEYLTNAKPK